jgi:hypothetical protein
MSIRFAFVIGFVMAATAIFFLIGMAQEKAYAVVATLDGTTCASPFGGSWDGSTNTCTITKDIPVGADETLTIDKSIIVENFGTIGGEGAVNISGHIINEAGGGVTTEFLIVINPGGSIENRGSSDGNPGSINTGGDFIIHSGGSINNSGIINNGGSGTIENSGTILNKLTINNAFTIINNGTIDNFGTITNEQEEDFNSSIIIGTGGTFNNEGTVNNSGTFTVECGGTLINLGTFTGNPVVIVPCEEPTIDRLIDHIHSLDISDHLKNSLSAPLKQALRLLNDDNPNNDNAVCGKLGAFTNLVNAKTGKGLSSEEAEDLINQANTIMTNLSC